MKTSIIRYAGLAILPILAPATMATTFTVSTTADSGPGSFRDAINRANADNDPINPTLIHFAVPPALLTPPGPGGVAVIRPLTPLPIIQNRLGRRIRIDGYTQPGSSYVVFNPSSLVVKVELDGSLIPTPYLPPPPPAPQFAHGLYIMSSNNRVQGLCVHSFPHDGISIQGIPLAPAGNPSGSNVNEIYWNLVGTDVTGLIPMPNGHGGGGLWGGIYVKVLPGSPGIANQNHILENVVSGNTIEGVGISNCPDLGSDVQKNHVERCYVGIDITGTGALGNGHDGIYIGEGAHHNIIDQNWIGANRYEGVGIVGYGPSGLSTHTNTLIGNRIGVDVNLNPMGNVLHGVAIGSYGGAVWGFAPKNMIQNNIIAYNLQAGVAVQEDPTILGDNDTSFNTITQNAIHHNGYVDPGYLGIDLAFEPGVTANDVGDGDMGANELINFPVITGAVYNLGTTTVSGTIDTLAMPVVIEVFTAIPGLDGSNHGQGAVYLGATTTNLPNWTVNTPGALPGQLLTATATDSAGNTSEFALNVPVWDENQQDLDFGDAPDANYMTLAASGGPAHVIVPGMYLGMSVDGEADGQPNANATGDDSDGNDDEDGVTFPLPLVPGQQAQIDIVASVIGVIDAWIDFDGNGTWHPAAEQIVSSASHPGGGVASYTFTVPATAVPGTTFARIRYSSGGGLLPFGPAAPDGEVEDHRVTIERGPGEQLDWGDAPAGALAPLYPTLAANNGARHLIVPGVCLGASVDAEADGQPHPHALGDDSMLPPGSDDEDGVVFLSPVVLGGTVSLSVTASVPGNLDAWVDFGGNGNWTDPSDQIFSSLALVAGPNTLSFPVPATAIPGPTYARFRFTTAAGVSLSPTGPAPDGEVEDYILQIEDGEIPHKMHWAQLPDPEGWDVRGYHPKILADDFRCTASGPITRITFWGSWRDDQIGQIENVHLSLHMDDRSGEFSKPGELLWQLDTATAGIPVAFDDPEFGSQGWYDPNTNEWNRPDHQMFFKYTVVIPEEMAFVQEEGVIYWLDIQMECFGGEWGWKTSRAAHFEDDAVWDDTPQSPPDWKELIDPETHHSLDLAFVIDGPEQRELDFGDAPEIPGALGYRTLLANNGARHVIATDPTGIVIRLGTSIDPEPDGQPTPAADGDDVNILYPGVPDDEDGVGFASPLVVGQNATIQVTASTAGFLDAWIDSNANGTWDHPAELVLSQAVVAGGNTLTFTVPAGATPGNSYARFRFNVGVNGLLPTGPAANGEVEDYQIQIEPAQEDLDFGDAPDGAAAPGYPTLLANNGARHAVSGVTLGATVDAEPDGQPDPQALGDDQNLLFPGVPYPPGDEDGIKFATALIGGVPTSIQVNSPSGGILQGWIDWNADGDWADATEQIITNLAIPPGTTAVNVAVPNWVAAGTTYARFRISSQPGLGFAGHAPDGEVEDYLIRFEELKWLQIPEQGWEGVDVNNTQFTLADDFQCTASGPITDIHFWGSFLHDVLPPEGPGGLTIDVSIWSDVPKGADAPYSHPGAMLWSKTFAPGTYAAARIWTVEEGEWWHAPGTPNWIPGADHNIYQFDFYPPAGEAFAQEEGKIYWLAVKYRYEGVNEVRFGWKTTPQPWNDDACYQNPASPVGWTDLFYQDPHPWAPDSLNLAFALSGKEPQDIDWGDAPDGPYPTLILNNGPRHIIVPGYQMGAGIDGEPNGQPDPQALGDDQNLLFPGLPYPPGDEDGVFFYPLISGQPSAIDVSVSGVGMIDAWIDFNGNGSWLDAGEQIAASAAVTPGLNQLTFGVPAGSIVTAPTFARVRFSSGGGLAPTGAAPDGEVEDYEVQIELEGEAVYDFGDAPEPPYATRIVANGARHLLGGPLWLGAVVDAEPDGQPDPAALGDDFNLLYPGVPDDEDGVAFPYALIGGQPSLLEIVASAAGRVDMWIDWNGNGSWGDPGDAVLTGYPVAPGPNYVMVPVPAPVVTGPTKARVRIGSTGFLPPTGFAPDGEVEDHDVFLYETGGMDFGDAPNMSLIPPGNYPTTMMDFGAAHFIDSLFLGFLIDSEPDGQPSLTATGDDSSGLPDEDGVAFGTPWISGSNAQFTVMVNPAAVGGPFELDLWVDWDSDGTWTQANEHVLIAQPVAPGPNAFAIPVPAGLGPVMTYARFRLTHTGTGVGYGGFVHGGEVEDYEVPIGKKIQAGIQINHSTVPKQIILNWAAEPGATSYSVYSSTNLLPTFPNPPNWTLEASVPGLSWSESITVPAKFYIVVAFP